jgi:hypothetical protein
MFQQIDNIRLAEETVWVNQRGEEGVSELCAELNTRIILFSRGGREGWRRGLKKVY